METNPTESWEIEFDAAFNWADQIKDKELAYWRTMYGFEPEDLKDFIRTQLRAARDEGYEAAAGISKEWDKNAEDKIRKEAEARVKAEIREDYIRWVRAGTLEHYNGTTPFARWKTEAEVEAMKNWD